MKAKFIASGLFGGIINFFLGWLVYGKLLMPFLNANTIHYEGLTKEMPVLWMLVISCLATGYFLAFIFKRWAGISTLKGGLIGGLIIGFFIAVMYDFSLMSMWNLYNLKAILVDALATIVIYGITGAAIGWGLAVREKKE
ncbi:MAG TPA: hypothetical protein PLJ84_10950 [Bacteroidales bacterium]|nr:hypothetical protein [Bacteroidales bacterium]